MATRSVAAIPAEAIPYLGIAVLIGGTAYELYEACQSIRDLEALYGELGLDEAPPEDTITTVCDPQLPSAEDLWKQIENTIDFSFQFSRNAMVTDSSLALITRPS